MKKKRHSLETIMRILRQAEAEKSITAVCREHEITEQTLYRWRRKYDNMDLLDTKRLKALDLACERYGAPKCIRSDNGPGVGGHCGSRLCEVASNRLYLCRARLSLGEWLCRKFPQPLSQ